MLTRVELANTVAIASVRDGILVDARPGCRIAVFEGGRGLCNGRRSGGTPGDVARHGVWHGPRFSASGMDDRFPASFERRRVAMPEDNQAS